MHRRRALLASLAVWCAVALLVWLDGALPHATTPVQGAFVQLIVAGVAAAFKWLADRAITLAQIIWEVTVIVGKLLWRFAVNLGGVFGKLYGLLQKFWQHVLRPFVVWADREITRLSTWLKTTLGPVIKAIDDLRRHVLEWYETYARPVFDTIDVFRRVLELLAAAHVKFAAELDAKLAGLEDLLLWPIRQAMLRLNQVADVVNRIVTLDGFLQRWTLIASMWKHVGDAWAVLLSHTPEGTSAEANAAKRAQVVTLDEPARYSRALNDWYGAGVGELAPEMAPLLDVWRNLTV